MRVMQLIDSLELGGAERMAVTYANMLSKEIDASFLCTTRAEGPLKDNLFPEVGYCFLDRKKTIDNKALQRVVQFIMKENIGIIHVHGTSYFFAYLIKLKYNNIKLLWHNHHGASVNFGVLKRFIIKKCLQSFNAVITVNEELNKWVVGVLKFPQAHSHYVSNFIDFSKMDTTEIPNLRGERSQRVICLANLKNPKEHLFLSKAFIQVKHDFPQATLHFVGTDYKDEYSDAIKKFIIENNFEDTIFIHGKQSNPQQYLNASAIGVIASSSEGLPLALLEYSKSNLAVITTNVGQCPAVVKEFGIIVPTGDIEAMNTAIRRLLQNKQEKASLAKDFFNHIKLNYSLEEVKKDVLKIYDIMCYG